MANVYPKDCTLNVNILDLPEEIALSIFSYLSASDLSDNVAKVCTLWREYSSAFQLWRHLDYTVDAGARGRREQLSVFHTASAFRKLTLKDSSILTCLMPVLFCNCSSIQELSIIGEQINPDTLSNLARTVVCGQWASYLLNVLLLLLLI